MESYFSGLPAYFGGKSGLRHWIGTHLAKKVPLSQWSNLTFIDAFSGGGSISQYAKLQGFGHVICNDLSNRSQLVLQGLIANNHQKLSLSATHQMALFPLGDYDFVRRHYGDSVFSERHASALDAASAYIQRVQDPVQRAQLLLILWSHILRFVCFGTSVGTSNRPYAEALDGKRSFQDLNPKRFQDGSLARLLQPVWQNLEKDRNAINRSIFPAQGKVSIYQKDIRALIPSLNGDILYCDPPYAGTLGYNKANDVLDAVLFGQLQTSQKESVFTDRVDALSELFDISRHIPVWMLSYNDKVLGLSELQRLIEKVDPSRQVEGFAKTYAHMPHVAKRENQELLIIATQKGV